MISCIGDGNILVLYDIKSTDNNLMCMCGMCNIKETVHG
jgi:hypothetical protein